MFLFQKEMAAVGAQLGLGDRAELSRRLQVDQLGGCLYRSRGETQLGLLKMERSRLRGVVRRQQGQDLERDKAWGDAGLSG